MSVIMLNVVVPAKPLSNHLAVYNIISVIMKDRKKFLFWTIYILWKYVLFLFIGCVDFSKAGLCSPQSIGAWWDKRSRPNALERAMLMLYQRATPMLIFIKKIS